MLETDTTAASVTSKATYPVFISNETTELKWLYKYYERFKKVLQNLRRDHFEKQPNHI
jgi:hypothetical protein